MKMYKRKTNIPHIIKLLLCVQSKGKTWYQNMEENKGNKKTKKKKLSTWNINIHENDSKYNMQIDH